MNKSKLYIAVGTALLLAGSGGVFAQQTDTTQPNAQAQPPVQTDTQSSQVQPHVTVEQAEPKVTVEQSQEPPKVTIEQSQEPPKVTIEQAPASGAAATTAQTDTLHTQADLMNNPLYSMTSDELEGRKVINLEGEKLGDIDDIVIDTQDNTLKAVVSVGGFLGIGDKDIVVSLDQLKVGEDNKLMLTTAMSKDQLKDSPEYNEDLYREVEEDDVALSQLPGINPAQGGSQVATEITTTTTTERTMDQAQMFSALDTNKDGKITREEAQAQTALNGEFERLDANADGQLEQSEFAQFETK